jgi:hypothetical protein
MPPTPAGTQTLCHHSATADFPRNVHECCVSHAAKGLILPSIYAALHNRASWTGKFLLRSRAG